MVRAHPTPSHASEHGFLSPRGHEQTLGGEGQTRGRLRGSALKTPPRDRPFLHELALHSSTRWATTRPSVLSGRRALGPGRGRHARSSGRPKHWHEVGHDTPTLDADSASACGDTRHVPGGTAVPSEGSPPEQTRVSRVYSRSPGVGGASVKGPKAQASHLHDSCPRRPGHGPR